MKKKITSVLLVGILLCHTMALSGCGTVTTLNRIGPALTSLGEGFNTELGLLRDAGVITPQRYDEIIRLDIGGRVKVIGKYLTELQAITASNKAQVLAEIEKAISSFNLPGVIPAGSTAAKVLLAISITLRNASVAIGFVQPPPAGKGMKASGVAPATVKVKLEGVPREAMKYMPAK